MFSFMSSIVLGSLKFEVRSLHSISMIFSWLKNMLVGLDGDDSVVNLLSEILFGGLLNLDKDHGRELPRRLLLWQARTSIGGNAYTNIFGSLSFTLNLHKRLALRTPTILKGPNKVRVKAGGTARGKSGLTNRPYHP